MLCLVWRVGLGWLGLLAKLFFVLDWVWLLGF